MKSLARHLKRYPRLYSFLRQSVYARLRSARRNDIFVKAYRDNLWGNEISLSGPGSDLDATRDIRQHLPSLLQSLEARSMLDIPCGDLAWMKQVPLGPVHYIGADIVAALVDRNRRELEGFGEFLRKDLLVDNLPTADLIFCRDCLVHLSNREVRLAFTNMKKSSSKYLATTTFPRISENIDTVTPYWRAINLEKSPFNLPPPLQLLRDFSDGQVNDDGKHIGVWRCDDLPSSV